MPAARPAFAIAASLFLGACVDTLTTGSLQQDKKPEAERPIEALVTQYAEAHEIDPAIAHSVVQVESGYNCKARNGRHLGIMQVNPRTARGVGVTGNLIDCRTGLEAGMRYLKQAIQLYGPGCEGISSYNTGIYKTGRCTGYGRKVVRLMAKWSTRR